jgi:hypothetical protein
MSKFQKWLDEELEANRVSCDPDQQREEELFDCDDVGEQQDAEEPQPEPPAEIELGQEPIGCETDVPAHTGEGCLMPLCPCSF